jgi:hypothetical protein
MTSIFRISIFFIACLSFETAFADDDKTATTRAGKLSITGDLYDMKLFFNGKKLSTDKDALGLTIDSKYNLGDKDAVLVAQSVSAPCQRYFFVTIVSRTDAKVSPVFGTCSDGPEIVQRGEKITLRMNDRKGRKVKYVFENGVISENGKILKME